MANLRICNSRVYAIREFMQIPSKGTIDLFSKNSKMGFGTLVQFPRKVSSKLVRLTKS
jgi:hypothetical protein